MGKLCVYGLWLNQKGKVIADSFVLRDGAVYWLVSIHSTAAAVRDRLEAYVIADDVVIEDVTLSWAGVALVGEGIAPLLETAGSVLPSPGEWSSSQGSMFFRGRRSRSESWEWLFPASQALPVALTDAGLLPGDAMELERMRIEARLPTIPGELGPGDLPNEAGLERDAISYSKGCYLGQEVMARLKTMGQVRRRLFAIRGTGGAPKCPATLYLGQKRVGELRSAVRLDAGGGFVGLAMLSLIGWDGQNSLSLGEDGSAQVHILPAAP